MIRINLLPFRLARKKENIRRQLSIFFLLIILTLAALFWYTQLMKKQIADIQAKTSQINQQITLFKEKADRVTKIQRDLKVLKEKLALVASLKKQRDKQLVLFDSMTDLIVPDRMWLESLSTKANTVAIKGVAYDNHTIAEFMKKLETSPLFGKVDLKTSKSKSIKNVGQFKEFELVCQKTKPPEPAKEKPSKQGKK